MRAAPQGAGFLANLCLSTIGKTAKPLYYLK